MCCTCLAPCTNRPRDLGPQVQEPRDAERAGRPGTQPDLALVCPPLAEALAAAASALALHPVLHPQQLPLPTLSWEPQPRPGCGGHPSSKLPCSAVPKAEPDPLSICGGRRQGSHKPQA